MSQSQHGAGQARFALGIGVVALGLCAWGAVAARAQFFQSYLIGYLFWLAIPAGSLGLLMLHHLVAGRWGFATQRLLEAATRTLPLMALLFLPIVLGLTELYPWARPGALAHDALLKHKELYLNVPFFEGRAVLYFGFWIVLAWLLSHWSKCQDDTSDASLTHKLRSLSGPGLVLYVLTASFAGIDWIMSLDPHWFSSIYGAIFVVGQALTTFAFMIVMIVALGQSKPLRDAVEEQTLADLGNLMMAFVLLWAYVSFSQFLIIWSGDLPEEIPWYLHRSSAGWQWVSIILIAFHFALPLLVLLSRKVKRSFSLLATVACGMLVMRLIELFWLIAPSAGRHQLSLHWMDLTAVVGVGGVWLAAFLWQLRRRAIVPLHDPRMQQEPQHG